MILDEMRAGTSITLRKSDSLAVVLTIMEIGYTVSLFVLNSINPLLVFVFQHGIYTFRTVREKFDDFTGLREVDGRRTIRTITGYDILLGGHNEA